MRDRKPFVLDGGKETQKIIFDERKFFTGKGAVNFLLFSSLFFPYSSCPEEEEEEEEGGSVTLRYRSPCLRRELEEEGSLQKWRLFLTYSPFPSVA